MTGAVATKPIAVVDAADRLVAHNRLVARSHALLLSLVHETACAAPVAEFAPDEVGGLRKRTRPKDWNRAVGRPNRMRHETGWQLEQVRPGIFVWTSPQGRVYTIGPEPPP